jgi:hypothetical protein
MTDEEGRYIMGYRVAPDCGEDYADYRIRSCPVANSNRLASVVQAYQRHRAGLMPITQSYPNPTCAIIEAIEVLHYNTEEAHYRATERTMREAKNNV